MKNRVRQQAGSYGSALRRAIQAGPNTSSLAAQIFQTCRKLRDNVLKID
jgi:hypothetical protein